MKVNIAKGPEVDRPQDSYLIGDEKYFCSCNNPEEVCSRICKKLDLPAPSVEYGHQLTTSRLGTYYPNRIRLNRNYIGVVLHELGHHINKLKYHGRMHDAGFYFCYGIVVRIAEEEGII